MLIFHGDAAVTCYYVYYIIIILSPSIMKSSPALIGWYLRPEAAHPTSEAE